MDVTALEQRCEVFVQEVLSKADDPAHDLGHVRRVVANARRLAQAEAADWTIVAPAAWLHDCVLVAKDSSRRSEASMLAAKRAARFLRKQQYPSVLIPEVEHAIAAHSFSAGIAPATLEARVVQDADRLDALGAIGIARCMMVGGRLSTPLAHPDEPFPDDRAPDDSTYVLDHFYVKLLRLAERMQTNAGREEAERRTRFLHAYLDQLRREMCA